MRHYVYPTLVMVFLLAYEGIAFAASPIPTFDKEAVTDYPYMRTGEAAGTDKKQAGEGSQQEQSLKGNTGTAEDPAFYIQSINLTGYPVPDQFGRLQKILSKYSNRSVKVSELPLITNDIMAYCRDLGYTVPLAVIPPQEVKNGVLEVNLYVASYDTAKISVNNSDVRDDWLVGYIDDLNPGDVITDSSLESVINNINDLPGVQSRAVLKPGSTPGTTALDVEVQKRESTNNYIFADNGGGHYSGRYRFGANLELNNPISLGDRFIVSGSISDEETTNYSIRYEFPFFHAGTRLGVAFSQTNYDISTFSDLYDSLGESRGVSVYGLTPLYRNMANRLTLIYGYDHRDITDEYKFKIAELKPFNFDVDKEADVFHIGLSGSHYAPNEFFQYSIIYWIGDIETEDGGAYYDGTYHKLTADLLKIWYVEDFNFRVHARGQLASRALDSSEQFYMGGMDGMRAYANGDGYGDSAYIATVEGRYETGLEGLELAAFVDVGAAKNRVTDKLDHLADAGVGLRYAKKDDWYAHLDFAHKIDGRDDRSEPGDNDYRVWFQVYKML